MICPNKNTPEWKAISNAHPRLAYYLWNKYEGDIPLYYTQPVAKEGVSELLESDTELANAVYEALGFKSKPNVILPIGTSGSGKSTFIKSLPQENLVVIEPDAMRVEFTGNMNDKSKDKEIYIEAADRTIQAIKQGKQVVFDTTNLTKDKRLPFIEAVKKAIPDANIQYKLMELNPELAKKRIKEQLERGESRAAVSDETIDRHAASYKQMLEDIKNEPISNFELTPQQKQQAQQLYSQYLDSIFPESKVEDIVYRGDENYTIGEKILSRIGGNKYTNGIYFAKSRREAAGYINDIKKKATHVFSAILNLKAPKVTDIYDKEINTNALTEEDINNLKSKNIDGLDVGLSGEQGFEYVVFEPEQIHILGNQQDIAGFKQFVRNLVPMTLTDMSNLDNTEFEVIKCRED